MGAVGTCTAYVASLTQVSTMSSSVWVRFVWAREWISWKSFKVVKDAMRQDAVEEVVGDAEEQLRNKELD